ncbi:MAG: hypothetical protein F6J87_01235 [Spirulina sp. SIO3F2]|nr:hypothetical protein [Spirulina sp. SIO3F2]
MQKRCTRNRKRSKRRAIFCPEHGCYLDSVSQKYPLYTESVGKLRSCGISRLSALMLVATRTAVPLVGEWLEAFWCSDCQQTYWYHVQRVGDREYKIHPAPQQLWSQVSGVIHPSGNPSVGEFTRRQARLGAKIRDFQSVG